uniref:Uncharacterized protein n=1 Tax=Anopheles merus TaxID=30066 RepID=A0A182VJ18_ANOME
MISSAAWLPRPNSTQLVLVDNTYIVGRRVSRDPYPRARMETVQEKENVFALIAFIKYGNVFGMLTGAHTLTGSTHTRIWLRKFLSPPCGMVLLILAPALGHPASCNGDRQSGKVWRPCFVLLVIADIAQNSADDWQQTMG